jgi:monovalent cation/hydrogen antiporter
MENYTIVIFILAIMIGLSALANRVRIPYPILLISAGIAIGFIPSLPDLMIDPDVIFLIFLPPLLYDAAFNISFREFRTNFNTISTLAVPLVFITATGIAAVAHYAIPGMSWPVSFVLGAILSATDAVAAMSITKGLGLSHKTNTILEGESLVNDASALVAYRFAVAAVTGATFVLWKASLTFLGLMAGGWVIGMVMGKLLSFVLNRVQKDRLVTISLTLLMPFITYLAAETVHVSGVIAVVMLGLSISRFSRKIFPDELRKQSATFWEVIVFLLNGLIFILIGLQFPYIYKTIDHHQVLPYLGYAFLITIVALVLRMARVFLQRGHLDRLFKKQTKHEDAHARQHHEKHHQETQLEENNKRNGKRRRRRISEHALLDVKTSVIISWSGMRGIVSLAIAIGLPEDFPQRSAVIFISVAVVLFTLIGQGLTLPWVVKKLGV